MLNTTSKARPPAKKGRVLLAQSEPSRTQKHVGFTWARLALSFVYERARSVVGLSFGPGQLSARVLSPLGEAGCGLALGQSLVGRLARHCVRSHATQQIIGFAGVRRQTGHRALTTDWLRRLTRLSAKPRPIDLSAATEFSTKDPGPHMNCHRNMENRKPISAQLSTNPTPNQPMERTLSCCALQRRSSAR